ncbi:MAG TPA: hypothetical protein VF426_02780 [Marmoricola sp.]
MIIRIMGEGQFDVPDDALANLNDLDASVERAVEAGDEAAFRGALGTLIEGVRAAGSAVAADNLAGSELILPPEDASLDEVRAMLNDDGLLPG